MTVTYKIVWTVFILVKNCKYLSLKRGEVKIHESRIQLGESIAYFPLFAGIFKHGVRQQGEGVAGVYPLFNASKWAGDVVHPAQNAHHLLGV